jgi:hypothetical protein
MGKGNGSKKFGTNMGSKRQVVSAMNQ